LPSWRATLDAAPEAVKRADALLAQEPELAGEGVAQQGQQLRARLAADEKDWQLLALYDRVRLDQSHWDLRRRGLQLAAAYPRLKKALADYGLSIGGSDPAQALASLRQRPLAVQKHVQAILVECLAWVPKEEASQRQWLVAVLESDPWLVQFQQALDRSAW